MATVKREGDKVYVMVADRMRYAGEIVKFTGHDRYSGKKVEEGTCLSLSRNRADDLGEISGCYKFPKELIDHDEWFDHLLIHETSDQDGPVSYLVPRELVIKLDQEDGYDTNYWIKLLDIKRFKL